MSLLAESNIAFVLLKTKQNKKKLICKYKI